MHLVKMCKTVSQLVVKTLTIIIITIIIITTTGWNSGWVRDCFGDNILRDIGLLL